MDTKLVKDLMLPLGDYAVVREDVSLLEAFQALEAAQDKIRHRRQAHRAVLVTDKKGRVLGKLGHLGFLKALEPKYDEIGNLDMLSRAGLDSRFVRSMMMDFGLWKSGPHLLRQKAETIRVRDVLRPVEENIDLEASLTEAMHKFIIWQTLSILVTDGGKVVGILRLSDLFDAISQHVRSTPPHTPSEASAMLS